MGQREYNLRTKFYYSEEAGDFVSRKLCVILKIGSVTISVTENTRIFWLK